MDEKDFKIIEKELKIQLPNFYKEIFIKKKYKKLKINNLFMNVNDIVEYNLQLLNDGYMSKKWSKNYFVIGSTRENNYTLIDLNNKETIKIFAVIEEDQINYKIIKKCRLATSIEDYVRNINMVYDCK